MVTVKGVEIDVYAPSLNPLVMVTTGGVLSAVQAAVPVEIVQGPMAPV